MMPEPIIQQIILPKEVHGQRLDVVLAAFFPDYSRSWLSKWIKDGAIKLNKHTTKPKSRVAAGDIIDVKITEFPAVLDLNASEPQNIPLDIVHEDSDILIINKPAGLVVHPGAGNLNHTLLNALLYHYPHAAQLPRAGIVHRLDKDTTGLMVVAKTLEAQTDLVRQMEAREIHRHYLTLVQGYLISGGTIDTNYGRHPRNRLKMAVCTNGKQAITDYSIHQHFADFTLLDVKLMTGRTHQIRVHMAYINHPVFGDQLYAGRMKYPKNADKNLRQYLESFKRQALHASTLSLTHPESKKILTFTAPLPEDFKTLLNTLEMYYEHDQG